MTEDTPQARGTAARVGIAALNLLAPGLGLLRVGRWRLAAVLLLALVVGAVLVFAALAWAPTLSPRAWLAVVIAALSGLALLYVAAIRESWRASRLRPATLPWWSRWYAIIGVVLVGWLVSLPLTMLRDHGYKLYFVPSESMRPTLEVDDRFVADQRGRNPVRIGDVVIVAVGDTDYVQRVVAKGGDRVELRGGVPIVNGRAASQVEIGRTRIDEAGATFDVRVLREQLPGDPRSHRVFDLGYSLGDDFSATTVPAGHYFLLGDNRDRAADSRFGPRDNGVAMVAADRIRGRALFKVRPAKAFGERLDR